MDKENIIDRLNDGWMNGQTDKECRSIYYGTLSCHEKEESPVFCNGTDAAGRHYDRWNRPGQKDKHCMISFLCGL